MLSIELSLSTLSIHNIKHLTLNTKFFRNVLLQFLFLILFQNQNLDSLKQHRLYRLGKDLQIIYDL